MTITEYNKDSLKATINVKEDNLLYTSIPYDKGMKVLVDGKEVEQIKIFDTLIGIELESGEHTIEFKYVPRGLKEGAVMSLIGIGLFIIAKKKEHD